MEMKAYNGAESDENEAAELAQRDTARIEARRATPVVERAGGNAPPFQQSSHDEMLKSVDRIADQWIDQLKHVRDNTQAVEQMVLSAITRVKHSITELHLLGTAVMLEAKRGEEVCTELADKIEQAMTTHQ